MRSITNKKICESCGTIDDGGGAGQKLLECAGCLSSYFCNTKCQQQSWPLHKKVCRQRKKSVVKIQSNWRGWYTRRQLVINDGRDRCEVCGVLDSKDKQLNICNGCKLSLFCSVRCQEYAWKKKNHKIICQERQMIVQVNSIVTIQSSWRGYLCRLAITKNKESSVLKIQTAWKTSMKRKRDKIRLEKQISKKLQKKSRQRAALKIQSTWKAAVKSRQKAASKIQSAWKLVLRRRELIDRSNRPKAIRGTMDILAKHLSDEAMKPVEDVMKMMVGFTVVMGVFACYISKYVDLTCCLVVLMMLICVDYFKDDAGFAKILNMTLAILGVCCMHTERYYRGEATYLIFAEEVVDEAGTPEEEGVPGWTWTFWLSETILMSCLMSNLLPPNRICLLFLQVTIISLVTLLLQGRLERYAALVILQILIGEGMFGPSEEIMSTKKHEHEAEKKIQEMERLIAEEEKRKRTMKSFKREEKRKKKILAKKEKKKKNQSEVDNKDPKLFTFDARHIQSFAGV